MTNTPPDTLVETTPNRHWTSLTGWIPLLALFSAAWFMARAWDSRGLPITIHFEAGHGLKAGDTLRFRGIDVGSVDEVRLDPSLGGVDVRLSLEESAEALARAGSRFWIVRPRIGSGGLDGLDTLVGARYLDVAPGPQAAVFTDHFVGLESAPVIVPPGALELVLEAETRAGLSPGSPVSWRSIQVGQVLSVGLASDARSVQTRIAINPDYASLVLTTTRFFKTGGLALDFGLRGLHLEMDSLQSILAGGVAFASPEEPAPPARTGQRFKLAPKPEDEWLEWRPALAVGTSGSSPSRSLPQPERAQLEFETGIFARDQRKRGWVLWTAKGLLGPADVLHLAEGAKQSEDGASLEVSGAAFAPIALPDQTEATEAVLLRGLSSPPGGPLAWPVTRMRQLKESDDCLAIGDSTASPMALSSANIDMQTGLIDASLPIDRTWHGAPVVARNDGALVGVIIVTEQGAKLAKLPAALVTAD